MNKSNSNRTSNFELYRIIMMLLIILHHYVVNSSLLIENGPVYSNYYSFKSFIYLSLGAFGKIGINGFLLITGYFMCTSSISLRKFLKLYGELFFYWTINLLIFIASGREVFTWRLFVESYFPFFQLGSNFMGSFFAFWILIPYLNILIRNLHEKEHVALIFILVFSYSILPFFSPWIGTYTTFNHQIWYCILYLIASYIRLYPKKIFESTNLGAISLFISILGTILSIWICIHSNAMKQNPYYFVSDSNKPLALLVGLSSFLFFKNLKIKQSTIINNLGAGTFGVLLMHAYPASLRNWLWNEVCKCSDVYYRHCWMLYIILSIAIIFIICSIIDFIRRNTIEKWYLRLLDNILARVK